MSSHRRRCNTFHDDNDYEDDEDFEDLENGDDDDDETANKRCSSSEATNKPSVHRSILTVQICTIFSYGLLVLFNGVPITEVRTAMSKPSGCVVKSYDESIQCSVDQRSLLSSYLLVFLFLFVILRWWTMKFQEPEMYERSLTGRQGDVH